jgi:hypothetical protein
MEQATEPAGVILRSYNLDVEIAEALERVATRSGMTKTRVLHRALRAWGPIKRELATMANEGPGQYFPGRAGRMHRRDGDGQA